LLGWKRWRWQASPTVAPQKTTNWTVGGFCFGSNEEKVKDKPSGLFLVIIIYQFNPAGRMEIIKTLAQKQLSEHCEFLLTPDALIIRKRYRTIHYERMIRLEELDFRTQILPWPTFSGSSFLSIAALTALVLLPSLFLNTYWFGLLIGLVAAYLVFLHSRGGGAQLLIEVKGEPLILNRNQPTPQAVDEFVAAVLAQARAHLRWKYGQVDPGYPTEIQVKNFRWLRDQKHITDQEYTALKAELFKPKEGETLG
jgi:hypothetical protein